MQAQAKDHSGLRGANFSVDSVQLQLAEAKQVVAEVAEAQMQAVEQEEGLSKPEEQLDQARAQGKPLLAAAVTLHKPGQR